MKIGEIIKMSILSILSIAAFGGAFLGMNRLVLNNATARTVVLAPLVAMGVQLPDYGDFDEPQIGIYESLAPNSGPPPAGAISAETAVTIAARYIYETFAVNIEGAAAHAIFNDLLAFQDPTPIWGNGIWTVGIILDGGESFTFTATIRADTGEVMMLTGERELVRPWITIAPRINNRP
ncbi:MAG: hypothetical protein LBE35_10720 [Clostridiales bacterium]|jgi:hypothetical protein|nr:hypothetical protein [Clostridiales bacterium]